MTNPNRNRIHPVPSPPSPETLSHFSSTPWTAPLFTNPSLTPLTNPSRIPFPPSENTTRDLFCSSTINTPSTIPAWQTFHSPTTSPSFPFGQILALVKLGPGVNGHENVAHGGLVGVLLDEVLGMACGYDPENEDHDEKITMTAYLNVGFKKPVKTPGVVLCRAWVERREGRKIWARGTVEDGEEVVMATGEALFVVVKGERERL